MASLYVEYALSFGVQVREGLWKMEYVHPEDASRKMQTLIPMDANDQTIGEEIDGVMVALPGVRLTEVMGWMYNTITRYPYYWPKEGSYVDKFSYDFEVELSGENQTSKVEITQTAYDILKQELRIQPPEAQPEKEVDIQFDTITGGGVLVKITITLDHAQPISEINLAPFSKYPMELASVMYEEDIETHHPKKELILKSSNEKLYLHQQTTESMRLQFPVVTAKRLTIILRQRNHEKNSYLVAFSQLNKNKLWSDISLRQENDLSGWDVYMEEVARYQKEVADWKKNVELYREKQAERERKLLEREEFSFPESEYRGDYKKAVAKYQSIVSQERQADGERKYLKDLTLYNKYLRNEDWANGMQ